MSDEKKKKGGTHLQKEERKPRSRKEKIRLAVILTLAILLALLLIGFAVYRSWAKPPDVQNPDDSGSVSSGGKDSGDIDSTGNANIVNGTENSGRKEDFYTFLVVGRDTGGGGNTDTILLAAYDVPNQKLNVMSIPRDTMVNIPQDIKRINGVYNYAGGGDDGVQALYDEVSQLVGFVPDYEVVIEWEAVGELVDAIDGVWFDVPRNMNYDAPDQDLHIHVNKGYQLLDGEAAMGVIRWRKNNDNTGYVTGDIGRIETQQDFLKAVIAQCLQVKNVTKIQEFAKIFTENVQTDLTLGNLVWFAEQAIFGGLTMENVSFVTMPGDYGAEAWSRTQKNHQSYVLPNAEELLAVVNEHFNPYVKDRTAEHLDIMSVNSDGSLSSSTGNLEDSKAATPPVYPKKSSAQESSSADKDPDEPEPSEEPKPSEEPQTWDEPEPPASEPPTAGVTETPDNTEPPSQEHETEPTEQIVEELPTLPPLTAAVDTAA